MFSVYLPTWGYRPDFHRFVENLKVFRLNTCLCIHFNVPLLLYSVVVTTRPMATELRLKNLLADFFN